MKKVLFTTIFILLLLLVGCDNNSETKTTVESVANIKNKKRSFTESKGQDVFNYNMSSKKELIDMLKNDKTKKVNNGAFADIIDLYTNEYKYILVPTMQKVEVDSIFIDSNRSYINYVFETPSMRICIEPINNEENRGIDTTDIRKYMEQKYDMVLNEEQEIPSEEQLNSMGQKTGYEYDSYIYVSKIVEFKDGKKNCILKKKKSEKSDTEYMLSFIEGDMIVKIFYYHSKDDIMNLKELDKLSFEREVLK
ncbi:hypothetical protein [uncultured Eubacterium sp.]|uniref:hypothetical protein n=1 Tax=uncultured Eubacterium sp. TaxID=165185 RepID=UPI0026717345|nr:hypothetical protein [uncultured Eubacterium sp.]